MPSPTRRLADPPATVVLVEPQIPPNTGNIARLCAAAGCHLILVGPLGFDVSDAALKRAGLDYWEHVSWETCPDLETFLAERPPEALRLFTARGGTPYTRLPAARGQYLLFGKESAGLPASLLERFSDRCYTIPMAGTGVRSLNIGSAAAIVVYDLLRRLRGF